ncbi:MAG TPA: dihydrofolate reductase family protein [Pyrinomonadaceae bacterium]|nr:dihydrofolate reductase family protein [Pyrinomonadaceae bacterium]
MRKVTFGGANSLDNYIARKDDGIDWIMHGREAAEYLKDYWKTIDTVLMGRKTYEAALKYSEGQSNPYPGVKSYVFSRALKEIGDKSVELVREDAAPFVRKLKKQEGKDICVMGGGDFARTLFEARLIDEIGFNIHPVLLGSGVPLFHEMKHQINLELLECKPFKNGCVLVTYRVKNKRGAR